MKRLVVISDLHCGHRAGLTPEQYQKKNKTGFLAKIANLQAEMWKWYCEKITECQDIDVLIVNGDAIDGHGEKSGGTELIEPDPNAQIEMAAECIEFAKAKNIIVINGTPYHTGRETDYECILAKDINAHYANHEFVECDGVKFDFKHKTSSSVIPHGRWTGPQRAALWNSLWAERGIQPNVNFLIRSHVHYYTLGENFGKTVITTPALQGWTKFGSRECEGLNDIGFLRFDCENGQADLTRYFFDMTQFKTEFIRF